ncbi:MAG: M48 family metallopeptidase [Bacteroidales bacterium]|nr:M48 family metallopeptidase [Bacteroidales bacterium]
MKKTLALVLSAALLCSCANMNYNYLLSGGLKALQAAALTDAQIQEYVHQYVAQLDAQSPVLGENDAYTKRLRKITSGLTQVDGIPLNFKVYKTNQVNAFACADGSVRVYSGLMDLMNDNEVLGVIGHEIGHVALKHTKKEMQAAMVTSAGMDVLASTNQNVAILTQSQLGAIGETILNAQYSKKQESAADDYAYAFLKAAGKSPACLAAGLTKLQSLENSGGNSSALVNKLFSSHPDTEARILRVKQKLAQDGIK